MAFCVEFGGIRRVAEQILLQGGDYLMALKSNQLILIDLTETSSSAQARCRPT